MSGNKREQGAEACGVGLRTEKRTNYSGATGRYDGGGHLPRRQPRLRRVRPRERHEEEGAPLHRHLEAGAGRQRQGEVADPLQRLPRLQGAQLGGQRRRPLHGLPDGQDQGAEAGQGTFLYGLAKAPKAQR